LVMGRSSDLAWPGQKQTITLMMAQAGNDNRRNIVAIMTGFVHRQGKESQAEKEGPS